MNHPAPQFFSAPVYSSSQEALVAAAAIPLAIYGYPLVETIRTCKLQTAVSEATGYGRAPVNTLSASERQWTHEDRDVVTPANDLLYFCGWANLADGAVTLRVPPLPKCDQQRDRYYVVELLDAWTNNFENLGPRTVPAEGGTVTLVGPGQHAEGEHVVACPTSLVWLLGRVLVQGPDDLAAAHAFESGFALEAPGKPMPQCVRDWRDTGNEALDFFQNLFNALREYPPAERELGAFTLLRKAGLKLEGEVDVTALRAEVRAGLENAYRQAMQLIEAHTRSQGRKSWGYSLKLGVYGDDWLQRACTAMKGLGALRADEAIYAMADFDADSEPLHGAQAYELSFPPGMLPPAQAFWSVSLYGEDRFFSANEIGRYAVGDRTPGLRMEPDGSLVIPISHRRPEQAEQADNWLPAPAGPFYLILRLYHPAPAFIAGEYRIPPVRRVA
ncbi:DUF1254 domain-containing protein [Cupriavidus sp. IK-TO18]|uniref:DUF1254 domain-containing protein n=1 Tax=unclassified Cupriavidus TaxID=2640874 RepID=UPI00189A54AF|nr:DUF1254 domain-containing protein [Cupriavidus sp. IK-TO18]MBF6986369.1 DUF1254 domain-containing protein [Cupriavidus sp. IK-TO18]